jgi:hypothetical protein
VSVRLQDSILNRVLRVFLIVRDVLSYAEKLAIVSCYQLLKCKSVRCPLCRFQVGFGRDRHTSHLKLIADLLSP